MGAISSTKFVSIIRSGENWRDISKSVLEDFNAIKTEGFKPNVGFIYITEELLADAASILTLFKSVTRIEDWSGCGAMGVCGMGEECTQGAAISILVGDVPRDHVRPFQTSGKNFKKLHQEMEPWLNKHDPMLVVVHVDPLADKHPAQALEEIDAMVGGFMTGGMASSKGDAVLSSTEGAHAGISGFIFSQDVAVAASLSQGCIPMGPLHEVSKADNHVIAYLDGRTPFDVFGEDMRAMAEKRLGYNAEDMILRGKKEWPNNLVQMLEGNAHIAFPVAGSDQNDFMVRNIMAIDPDTGVIAVSEFLEDGQKIMFVHRDDETVRSDLSKTLVSLRERILHEKGVFAPKAALYVSCVARANVSFAGNKAAGGEMALIREILGDIPVAGFYANGEISNNRLYGYTGVITLFL